jgi:hypothetical protein
MKITRAVIGALLAIMMYSLFYAPIWLGLELDTATLYLILHVLPNFLISFFIYGLFPIMCLKGNLISMETPKNMNQPRSMTPHGL